MPKALYSEAGTHSLKASALGKQARAASRRSQLKYLIGGNHEGVRENLGRATAAAALRKARQLLHQGYVDVRICTPRGQVLLENEFNHLEKQETDMAKERRGNREVRKPKKEKIKVIAAAPSQKAGGWQPILGSSKKK
jgi:hypothetical protein